MEDASFGSKELRPAWPMPARYAEIMTRLRAPIFTSIAQPPRPSTRAAIGAWLARLRLSLCPCCHARG